MAFRWIAALAMTGFSMLAGRTLGGRALRGAEQIRRLMDELQTLRVMTLDKLMPMSAALSESRLPVLRLMGEKMRKDGALAPEEAWTQAAAREREPGGCLEALGEEEIGLVTRLFEALTCLGRREHEERYEDTVARLGRREEEKRAAGRDKLKLFTYLGALTGLAVSVMIA